MATTHIILSSLAIVAIMCCFIKSSEGREFSVSLIHRDSPDSPLYNPDETPYQRFEKAVGRSLNRINRPDNARLSAQSELITDVSGEYLMNISIGTPPFRVLVVADTGSDITWTRCSPNDSLLFNPTLSSTYKTLPCNSTACAKMRREGISCDGNDGICHYVVRYVDRSHTIGDIALETLNLDSSSAPGRFDSFPNILIGCGYDNNLTHKSLGSGFVGLGRGPASLVSQLGHTIGWRFSHCLPLWNGGKFKSTIDFGVKVTGRGVVSTPLLVDPSRPYYYYLNLEAISVGDVRVPFRRSTKIEPNIVIDSGTTITAVPTQFYFQLSSEVEKHIVGRKRAVDPSSFFDLCYEVDPAGPNAPPIKVHFLGADLELPVSSVFAQVSDTVTCFMFRPTDGDSFYGNMAQQNFLVGYDLAKKTVSFKPADCGHK